MVEGPNLSHNPDPKTESIGGRVIQLRPDGQLGLGLGLGLGVRVRVRVKTESMGGRIIQLRPDGQLGCFRRHKTDDPVISRRVAM